jgi:hypothetical protein
MVRDEAWETYDGAIVFSSATMNIINGYGQTIFGGYLLHNRMPLKQIFKH